MLYTPRDYCFVSLDLRASLPLIYSYGPRGWNIINRIYMPLYNYGDKILPLIYPGRRLTFPSWQWPQATWLLRDRFLTSRRWAGLLTAWSPTRPCRSSSHSERLTVSPSICINVHFKCSVSVRKKNSNYSQFALESGLKESKVVQFSVIHLSNTYVILNSLNLCGE